MINFHKLHKNILFSDPKFFVSPVNINMQPFYLPFEGKYRIQQHDEMVNTLTLLETISTMLQNSTVLETMEKLNVTRNATALLLEVYQVCCSNL